MATERQTPAWPLYPVKPWSPNDTERCTLGNSITSFRASRGAPVGSVALPPYAASGAWGTKTPISVAPTGSTGGVSGRTLGDADAEPAIMGPRRPHAATVRDGSQNDPKGQRGHDAGQPDRGRAHSRQLSQFAPDSRQRVRDVREQVNAEEQRARHCGIGVQRTEQPPPAVLGVERHAGG